ncbi:ArsR family transcriptional regulator, partial [Nostoc sp.]
ALASKVGRSEATVLQQAHYWMNVRGGKIIDGIKWFWKTYQQWAEELSLSVSTIRRAIAKLKTLGLVAIEKLSAKTYYQANWYTVKNEAVELLIFEHIDAIAVDASMCSKQADDIKDFSHKDFSTQQHTAVAEKKEVVVEEYEPGWEFITLETNTWEQTQTSHYVDDSTLITSVDDIDPDEDLPSTPEIKAASSQNKPTKNEIKDTCVELKRLRINPEPCLGVIKKYWGNVSGAIARVKEAISEGWCDNPTGLFINSCKSGTKGKNAMPSDVSNWLDWAYKKRIALAFQEGFVHPVDGSEPMPIEEMMKRYPIGES